MTTERKAAAFQALHTGEPFVIPNPWDAGSARVLEALGFKALATTSSGFAFTLGRLDGGATLDEVAAHVAALNAATELPVSVDLENGYGADPESAANAVTRVAEVGAVGGSIEDWDPGERRLYEHEHAVERVAAAVQAARSLPFPFMLTARSENHLRGNPDLDDTVRRPHGRGDPCGLRGGHEAGQRPRASPVDGRRHHRSRSAADQRRRRADLGGRRRLRERRTGDPRPWRPLGPRREAAAPGMVQLNRIG